MEEEEKKSNKKPAIIVIVYCIAIVILVGIIYSYLLEEEERDESSYHCLMSLSYEGTIDNGVHRFDVADTEHGRSNGIDYDRDYELHKVRLYVHGEVNGNYITIINGILLKEAVLNSSKSNLYNYTSYFDNDSDNIISIGDYFTFYIDPSYNGIFLVRLNTISGSSVASYYLVLE